MRKLYNEFFYVPEHGKVREKVMLARVAMTVVIMVVCLAAMSFTAYAYFSCNVTSGSNVIKAASFEANVSITITNSNNDPVTVIKSGRVQTANLNAGRYTIELTRGNSTAHKGFCVITIGDKNYYTDQIGVDAEKNLTDAKVEFELLLSSPTRIKVLSHWGTSVYYGYKEAGRTEIFIVDGATLNLTTKTATVNGDKSEETTGSSPENTTSNSESSSTQTSESTVTPSTETTKPNKNTAQETTEIGGSTSETESGTAVTEPTTTQQTQSTESTDESTEAEETQATEMQTQPTEEVTGGSVPPANE